MVKEREDGPPTPAQRKVLHQIGYERAYDDDLTFKLARGLIQVWIAAQFEAEREYHLHDLSIDPDEERGYYE